MTFLVRQYGNQPHGAPPRLPGLDRKCKKKAGESVNKRGRWPAVQGGERKGRRGGVGGGGGWRPGGQIC